MAKTKAAFEGNTFDADPVSDLVKVRVLKRGDGKISTGVHDAKGGDILYEKGEEFILAEHIAEDLEGRDFVEILGKTSDAQPVPDPVAPEPEPTPEKKLPQLDHDGDGEPGGSLPKRGPGRPPNASREPA